MNEVLSGGDGMGAHSDHFESGEGFNWECN
jgi:hypothetical protein